MCWREKCSLKSWQGEASLEILRSETEIKANWNLDISQPLVSISCITYNHENYIEDALIGFLIQETDFPFEVLIHDDASTDKTAKIIRKYEKKYPSIVKPIYQKENQHSKGIKPNRVYNFPRAKGKYIALCEGDDYWIDPYKLQKQYDILENNPNYGLVHTNCKILYQDRNKLYDANELFGIINRQIRSKSELFYLLLTSQLRIRTATVLFRTEEFYKIKPNNFIFLMGDTPLWLDLSQQTNIYYLDRITAVYRVLRNSASRSENKKKNLRFKLSMTEMRIYYCQKYHYKIPEAILNKHNNNLINYTIYDSSYKPLYDLMKPTKIQKIKYSLSKKKSLSMLILITNFIKSKLINVLHN